MKPDELQNDWNLEDTGTARTRLKQSRSGSRFDPYQGTYEGRKPSRKRDLRKVQEWLEARDRAEQIKRENDRD
jgi:hypothetical protein